MTAVYDKLGLKFLYPENWKLTEESDVEMPDSEAPADAKIITLETPDGATSWSVYLYAPETDSVRVLKETLSSLQETYQDLEISPHAQMLGNVEAKGVEALFYCLDFLIRAQIHTVPTEKYLVLFWSQAEDRDFDDRQIVFQAISISLLQSINK